MSDSSWLENYMAMQPEPGILNDLSGASLRWAALDLAANPGSIDGPEIALGFTETIRAASSPLGVLDSLVFHNDLPTSSSTTVGRGLGTGVVAGLGAGLGGGTPASVAKRGYSVAAEVRLPVSAWGRGPGVHENVANAMLHDMLLTNPGYRDIMEELIPGVTESVSSTGGRATPADWIWHHELESGLMRLVPEEQHTSGSIYWRALHPEGYGGYASWARAFGAPKR
jgi:hypothetical protein